MPVLQHRHNLPSTQATPVKGILRMRLVNIECSHTPSTSVNILPLMTKDDFAKPPQASFSAYQHRQDTNTVSAATTYLLGHTYMRYILKMYIWLQLCVVSEAIRLSVQPWPPEPKKTRTVLTRNWQTWYTGEGVCVCVTKSKAT